MMIRLTELGGGGEELLGQGEGLARHQRLVLVLQAAQLELGARQSALQQIGVNILLWNRNNQNC